ncbi:HDIG domain-containing metalloprotein [Clostridium sp. LIBA-8841]|uniref:HDIG domain-containing metalloprotein n=1 Tax=Clostridium sp. LIBA-8841 TaxID=2987530 RepID=UPI002AC4A2A3|nr:HDIG domain-containing metalloprotein [Clostridium sp. LIBA-8841]MDZ5252319.1 HDIG domain-containing protein [Clostridium sp. LIBA-8841]
MNDRELFEILEKHILEDKVPSKFLISLNEEGELKNSFLEIIKDLEKVQQEKKHHPEGNVWNHTLQVLDEAARLKEFANNKREFMWAALLHDIGKKDTTKMRKGRWTAYDHDRVGAEITKNILRSVVEDEKFIIDVSNLIRYHMSYLYVDKNLPFVKPKDMVLNSDLHDIALLTYCDRVGRGEKSLEEKRKILNSINDFIEKTNSITNKKYEKLNILEK